MERKPVPSALPHVEYLPWEEVDLLDRVLFLLRNERSGTLTELMRATTMATSEPYRRRCLLRRLRGQQRDCVPNPNWVTATRAPTGDVVGEAEPLGLPGTAGA